jgi:hypothetical protein
MKPMDDDYIRDKDIVRRYLRNTLMPEEAIAFETYVLDKPALLEQLELDAVLIENMPHAASTNVNKAAVKTAWWKPLYSHFVAIAASCSLLVVMLLNTQRMPENLSFSPAIVYLENYRSANEVTRLHFTANESFKVIAIDTPPNSGASFDVQISDSSGKEVFSQHLTINENNEITFLLNKNTLGEGNYSVSVSGNHQLISAFDLVLSFAEKGEL